MSENKEWKEATSGQVVKLKEGEKIEGTFISIEESTMYSSSYSVKLNVNNEIKVVFVNNIVKDLIESNNIKTGQEIAILYVGKQKTQDNKKEYNNYKLFFK